jgi:hypothetical protein|nr:hypothetical protein [Kofleriaceae bacterium]
MCELHRRSGHRPHHTHAALLAGGAAFVAAVAILVFVPSHREVSAVGAVVVLLFVVKHVALATTVGVPAAAAVRRWRARSRGVARTPLRPASDGYVRTGEAEPHRGLFRLEHDVRELPPSPSPHAIVALDADKRMTMRFLSDLDGDALRAGLAERYAKRGHRDAATVERFLAPLAGPIARGEALAIAYDARAGTTRLALRDAAAEVRGADFMAATWRLWFDDAAPRSLTGALAQNL